jgi:hypothetical protein
LTGLPADGRIPTDKSTNTHDNKPDDRPGKSSPPSKDKDEDDEHQQKPHQDAKPKPKPAPSSHKDDDHKDEKPKEEKHKEGEPRVPVGEPNPTHDGDDAANKENDNGQGGKQAWDDGYTTIFGPEKVGEMFWQGMWP